ncbi:MAG: hypothetical protein ACKOYG_01315 [Ilumatobacteraceae bacterium]
MTQLFIAVAVVAGSVVVGLILQRRRSVEAPTQPKAAVPAQVDRADFAPGSPWAVIVFSSASCHTCADVVRKAQVLASPEVAVVDVEFAASKALHAKYDIQAVPIVAVADADGVVRAGFAGPVTATDLWAAVAEARLPGSLPSDRGCAGDPNGD